MCSFRFLDRISLYFWSEISSKIGSFIRKIFNIIFDKTGKPSGSNLTIKNYCENNCSKNFANTESRVYFDEKIINAMEYFPKTNMKLISL